MQKHWREVGIILLLTAVTLMVFFYPATLRKHLIYSGDFTGSDLLELNIPRRALAARTLAQGELPLWEPHLGNGVPLLAEGQAGVFYPTTLPLYMLFSLTAATNLSILLTLGVAMLGSYAWARTYKISPPAAFFCALAYGLGGAFIFRLKHLNMIQVIAWLPCCLALIRWYWQRWNVLALLALMAVWSWQFLAGHPHVTYICWLSCYLYALVLVLAADEFQQPGPQRGRGYYLLGKMLLCTCGVLLLSAAQLLPTIDLVQDSTRASVKTWENLQRYPFKLSHLTRMLMPYSQGNPAQGTAPGAIFSEGIFWENAPYIGVIPLFLAAVGLFRRPRRSTLAVACLALLCLWGALGPQGGLYWIFWKFCPAFNLFRFPARLLIPFQCVLGLLAACGAQAVIDWLKQKYNSRVSSVAVFVLIAGTLLDLFLVNSAYQEYLPPSWEEKPLSWRLIEDEAQRVYAPTYMVSGGEMLKSGWKNSADKLLFHARVLSPDLAALWGVRCHSDHVVFEGGIELAAYFNLQTSEACHWLHSQNAEGQMQWHCSADMYDWLRMQNVSHLLSFYPLLDAGANSKIAEERIMGDPAFPESKLYIYTLKDTLPCLRLLPRAEATEEVPLFVRQIAEKLPEASSIDSLYERRVGSSRQTGMVRVIRQGNTYWELEVDCSEPSYLFMAVNYDHNWRVWQQDGQSLPIVRFNHAYQAISLEPGQYHLRIKYQSQAFAWGWKISAAAWLALLLSILICGLQGNGNTKVKEQP